jgi:thiol-disulfide isomerase/thioredoxin
MHLYILLGILVLILVVFKLYGSSVLGFQNQAAGGELLICKAEWCGHCKRAMPDFQKLVSSSPITKADGSSVTVRLLDSDADADEIKNLNVRGFPTILYQSSDGSVSNYNGERTAAAITAFVNNM